MILLKVARLSTHRGMLHDTPISPAKGVFFEALTTEHLQIKYTITTARIGRPTRSCRHCRFWYRTSTQTLQDQTPSKKLQGPRRLRKGPGTHHTVFHTALLPRFLQSKLDDAGNKDWKHNTEQFLQLSSVFQAARPLHFLHRALFPSRPIHTLAHQHLPSVHKGIDH